MYEVTVSALRKEQHLLEHIKREAVPAIAEMDGIFTEMSDESRSYFSVACSDTYRFQLRRLLSGSIAETIALGYKNIFVRNCLHVNKGNFLQNVLINTMCVFDKTYDQQIVSKIIDVDKPVFIDGYCNFRLQPLKKKVERNCQPCCGKQLHFAGQTTDIGIFAISFGIGVQPCGATDGYFGQRHIYVV